MLSVLRRNWFFCMHSLLFLSLSFSSYGAAPSESQVFSSASNEVSQNSPSIKGLALPRKPLTSPRAYLKPMQTILSGAAITTRGATGDLYKRMAPSVVEIYTAGGSGSGVVLNNSGVIVTNQHVVGSVKEVAVRMRASLKGSIKDHRMYLADVLRVKSSWDLALIRLRDPPDNLKPMSLGYFSQVEIGMDVYAIGHPKGEAWSFTKGIVSQVRSQYAWGDSDQNNREADVIQTQTPINPGNSGGPLFSEQGVLVGINTFGAKTSEGLNFAVSVDHVRQLMVGDTSRPLKKNVFPTSIRTTAAKSFDQDRNNRADLFCFDTDGNQRLDICAKDENEDGEEEYWLLDLNENRKWDGMVSYVKVSSGLAYRWDFDYDEDGSFDMTGLDRDADGVIDYYQKASN